MGKPSTTHHRWNRVRRAGIIGESCVLPDGRAGVLVEYGVLDKTGEWHTTLDVYTHAKILCGNIENDFTEVYCPIPRLRELGTVIAYR